jgi:hypothetical protein
MNKLEDVEAGVFSGTASSTEFVEFSLEFGLFLAGFVDVGIRIIEFGFGLVERVTFVCDLLVEVGELCFKFGELVFEGIELVDFALDEEFPEGSVVNPQDPSLSYHNSWVSIQLAFNAFWRNLSTAFFARGFHEEVVTGYSNSDDVARGEGTTDDTGEHYQLAPLGDSIANYLIHQHFF